MSIVYVTQDVLMRDFDGAMKRKFDLTSAAKYGEIKILIPAGQSLVSSVPVVRQLNDLMRDFSRDDYLLPLGDPAIMAAASGVATLKTAGCFSVLKWDRRSGAYLAVPLDLSGKAINQKGESNGNA